MFSGGGSSLSWGGGEGRDCTYSLLNMYFWGEGKGLDQILMSSLIFLFTITKVRQGQRWEGKGLGQILVIFITTIT